MELKELIARVFRFRPAQQRPLVIVESLSHLGITLRNRIWYRGDPNELDQFFKATGSTEVGKARFWAAVPSRSGSVRKLHSGLPGEIVDKLADILTADLDDIEVNAPEGAEEKVETADSKRWAAIAEDNKFGEELFPDAVKEALITGDGAFKISVDTELTEFPIIEFVSGEQLEYEYERGRLQSIKFISELVHDKRTYKLEETYERGKISYKLYDDNDKEVELSRVPEAAKLTDVHFTGDYMMAVPLRFFRSAMFKGRGQSIYDRKSDAFDALDEVISQWIDAIRAGRIKNYIPEDLIGRDKHGRPMEPNAFDNQFIRAGTSLKENAVDQIQQVQAHINYPAYVESYANTLDMCLQGILSPSTLGIDLKKTDNATAQREKEKATLYTRGKLIDVLNEVLPELVKTALMVEDTMRGGGVVEATEQADPGQPATGQPARDDGERYRVSITFGEYASPDFDTQVAVVGQARTLGIMSLEKAIAELYGDTMTDEEKQTEIDLIRGEIERAMGPMMPEREDDPPYPIDGVNDEDDEKDKG